MKVLILLTILYSSVFSKVYFYESFDGDYETRWVESTKSDAGKLDKVLPKSAVNSSDYKLKTSQDARFYHTAAKFDDILDTSKSTVVVQFSIQFEQDIDCGGGYVKVAFPESELSTFDGETKYAIMFGPDVCGYDTKMIHAILEYKGKNHLIKNKISFSPDTKPHIFTFIMKPDKTYEVLLDGASKSKGLIVDEWDLLSPKTILDPEDKKPSDWVDEKEISDPEDKKPEDWDKLENIPDASAKKPEDWSDEDDGEWTAPMVANPEYKGEWKPKNLPNPAYKGEWEQKTIANPEYAYDEKVAQYTLGTIGVDIWQVKSGTLYDDILITDSEEEAKAFRDEMNARISELNKAIDEEQKKADEKKKAEKPAESSDDDAKGKEDADDDDVDSRNPKVEESEKSDSEKHEEL